MLAADRVGVRRPGLVGQCVREQSEPSGDTKRLFHDFMLRSLPEKSSFRFKSGV